MDNKRSAIRNIDEYISGFPSAIQSTLNQIREVIKKASPGAEETISYGMPSFKMDGKPLVYFAAFKNHIGFYPLPQGMRNMEKEIKGFKTSKGAIQFPLNNPMPLNIIIEIVKFRMKQVKEKGSSLKNEK